MCGIHEARGAILPSSPFTIGSYSTPHNTFAMLIVEVGWLGLIAYIFGVVGAVAYRCISTR